jgi:DNA-binding NtrC family response regulator
VICRYREKGAWVKKHRILVVDDDRDFAESLADALELVGHNVMLAFSGEEATRIFSEHDFDITFMDVKLPGKTGVESFIEMRRIKPAARVIMMTGYSVPQLLEQAVENGAWDLLHKPLEMQNVLKMIEKIKPCGILIADDDPDFLKSLKPVLENEGYQVHVAKDGEEVLSKLQAEKVDVLVLDLRMPVMNGLETYLKMKEAGTCVPTIIVTAYGSEERESVSILDSLSVYGVLNKPFDTEALFDAIEGICESNGFSRDGAVGEGKNDAT